MERVKSLKGELEGQELVIVRTTRAEGSYHPKLT